MLSRTADHLFWMARYIERAENTARMLDVQVQTSLLPSANELKDQGWRSLLGISELTSAYAQRYGAIDRNNVLEFMVRDPLNPSSIWSCLQQARENARAVRGSLTTEVWETNNLIYLELQQQLASDNWMRDPRPLFEWVKYRSHLSRGVTIGTMLKDEAFYFIRLGTFLERADNTARLLDVKYHGGERADTHSALNGIGQIQGRSGSADAAVSPPRAPASGSSDVGMATPSAQLDYYYWAAVLRSVSAFEIYRKVYRDVITPDRVAELLMLRADMPRSLLACLNEVVLNLVEVRNDVSSETERRAGLLRAELHFGRIEDLLQQGLHAYLSDFLERVYDLGNRISRDFLVPLVT